MNVYDTANKLAGEIKLSQEYLDYKNAKEEVDRNPAFKEKVAKFEELRYAIQLETIKGEEQEKDKVEETKKLYAELVQDPMVKKYFEAEFKFSILLADINKIIAESVEDVLRKNVINYKSNRKYMKTRTILA